MLTLAAFLALGYGAALGLLWFGQERLIFLPTPLPQEHRFAFGDDVQERWVEVDGARLNALHLKRPGARGVVFFLHGNAGNLDSWFINADFYRRANIDLFMIDYRGYGKSSGRIQSEAQLHADVRRAWDLVAPEYEGRAKVIYGRSLGTGLAATLAAEVHPDLTVLVSPYSSMVQLGREHYRWVPGALLRYPMRTDEALKRVRGPVFIAHGAQDELIHPSHSEALQRVAPRAEKLLVPGAGHNDLHLVPVYLQTLAARLAAL